MEGSVRGRDVRKLNTQGCCFLCLKLNTIKLEVNGEVDDTEPELIVKRMSMRCLTRFLKLTLDGMEQATSAATSKAASKPEVDVEVDLCEPCEKLASRFSSLFQQLEKVQMELEFYLGEIRHTVLHSSEAPELVQNYSKRMTRGSESLSQLKMVDKLRREIGEKSLKTRRTPTVSLKRIERLPKQEVSDPVEEMDSVDDLADFAEDAWSSMENCAAQESENSFDERSTPEMKKDPEDSPAISPNKDLKQSMKEKSHCSEVLYFAENVDDTNVGFPDLGASPTSSSKPTEDHQEDLYFGCRDNETPSLMPPVKVKPKESMYYTKYLSTGMYECKNCDKTSKRPETIADHFKSVHLKLTFKCDVCNISVLRLSSLTKHKKTCRNNLEKGLAKKDSKFTFICEECGKRFETKVKLSSHLLGVHKNADRYPCDLCDKKFTKSDNLKKHRNAVHLGKRFYCEFCSKSFAYEYDLQLHKKNLHKN